MSDEHNDEFEGMNEDEIIKFLREREEENGDNVEQVDFVDKGKSEGVTLKVQKSYFANMTLGKKYEVFKLEGYPATQKVVRDKESMRIIDNTEELEEYLLYTVCEPVFAHYKRNRYSKVLLFTTKEANEAVSLWLKVRGYKAKTLPHFIGLGKPDTYCHNFEIVPRGEAFPHWEEILSRMSNANAFAAYIASIFIHDSPLGQYVWLHGQGGDSKSVIGDALTRILGAAAHQINSVNAIDKFFVGYYWLKRLVICQEANSSVAQHPRFKSLVADGIKQEFERKYAARAAIPIQFKWLLNSNDSPDVLTGKSDMRRIIYCTVSPYEGKAMHHDKIVHALVDEFADFLVYGLEQYEKLCDGKRIESDQTALQEVIEENEVSYYSLFRKSFYFIHYKNLPNNLKSSVRLTYTDIYKTIMENMTTVERHFFTLAGFQKYLKAQAEAGKMFCKAGCKGKRYYGGLIKKSGDLPHRFEKYRNEESQ